MKRRSSPPTIRSRMLPSSMPTSCSERDEVFARTPLRQSLGSRTPMPIQVLMPALSPTMEKGNLAKWIKSEGDKIKAGDVIAEIETDKATMEVEAVDDGTLGKILVPEGTADVAGVLNRAAPVQPQKAAESAPPARAEARPAPDETARAPEMPAPPAPQPP